MQVRALAWVGARFAAAVWLAAAAVAAQSQAPETESFEELARRAASLLDSRPDQAADFYRRALAIRSTWAEGWLYLGAAYYQSARYAEASDAFRKGLKLLPNSGTAWAFLGLCEAELDNAEQALADIGKGEALGLGNNLAFETAVRVKATQLMVEASNFGEAMMHLEPLSRKSVDSRAVADTMGLAMLGVPAKYSELSGRRREVVKLAGEAAWSLATRKPAEAEAAYAQLLRLYPEEAGVHYAYGMYLMETDPAAALEQFQTEARLHPKHWPALIMVGSLETREGRAEPALDALQKAIRIAPPEQRWVCRAQMGQAHMTADRLEPAIAEFETAVRLMPDNASIRYLLAQAYRRAGRQQDAERENAAFEKLKVRQDPLGVGALRPFGND